MLDGAKNEILRWLRSGLAIGLSIVLAACGGDGGGTSGGGGGPLAVTLTAAAQSVPPGTSTQVTAAVTNDASNAGVNWKVSCPATSCGSVSPTQTASGVATTYSAPGSAQQSDLQVTIIATSVSKPTTSQAVNIQIPGVAVATQIAGTVIAGTTAQFVATVSFDPANQGVRWAASCTAASCGSLSPTSSPSGGAVTYTAPAVAPPGDLTVTITVTLEDMPAVQQAETTTVPAIALVMVPVSALLPLNVSQNFAATVNNDNFGKGVTWALSQNGARCSPACGMAASLATGSGSPTTYIAPEGLPASILGRCATTSSNCDGGFTPDPIRVILQTTGIHIWSTAGDTVHTDGSLLVIHAAAAGPDAISLPAGVTATPLGGGASSSGTLNVNFARIGQTLWFQLAHAP